MAERETSVSINGGDWLINGRPTYSGRSWRGLRIEGLLLNSRMANGIFDDLNPITRALWAYPDTGEWDPNRNTQELIAALPTYRQCGLVAIGLNLQGASPFGYYRYDDASIDALLGRIRRSHPEATQETVWQGLFSTRSQPWETGAFNPDGTLRPEFLTRAAAVIEAADKLGMVVCLGLFYFGQDERLVDEAAVFSAVDSACRWVLESGFTNVVVEIANEVDIPLYEHEVLTAPKVHTLIERVRAIEHQGRRLLAGTSVSGRVAPTAEIVAASDFVLLHGNHLDDPAEIVSRIANTRSLATYRGQPLLFNEDDHFDFDRAENNFFNALAGRAGWGYFDPGQGAGGRAAFGDYVEGYQNPPINWGINTNRKAAFFEALRAVTGN
ncbi:MAG: hypothetical protein O7H40_05970 [Gammaproteobacteria bacterium]|nr:hypothetical protein [Gammaproteobacteria bacterium]